jgi:hypothetical protein
VELAALGLYITHLFSEREVFLRRRWEKTLVKVVRPALKSLQLFRPSTLDLVLTKMMRGNDPQDMADAKFMIKHDDISEAQLELAFSEMKPVELVEHQDAFKKAKPLVLQFARKNLTK